MNAEPHPQGYDGRIDGGATPALDLVLGMGWAAGERAWSVAEGKPSFCSECPFSSRSTEPYEQISNDVTEAHYVCEMLGEVVWAEEPRCTPEQWRARAQLELEAERETNTEIEPEGMRVVIHQKDECAYCEARIANGWACEACPRRVIPEVAVLPAWPT